MYSVDLVASINTLIAASFLQLIAIQHLTADSPFTGKWGRLLLETQPWLKPTIQKQATAIPITLEHHKSH